VAIGPTSQRDQILVSIAIVALALVGAFWYFVYEPRNVKVDELAAHVDSLDESNQKARALVAKGTGSQIRAETATLKENLGLMRTLVPAGNEVPALIDQVSTAARHASIDVAGVEPEPVIEGDMFDTYRYKMKLNGSYHEIADVLARIGSLSRIVAPMNLTLTIPQNPPKAVPGKQFIASAFEIQTYVVRTSPPKPKPKKEADKPADKPAGGPQ
jgi:type IV pilus assembly protein PilO